MQDAASFDLSDFLPYLLNRASEETSLEFQAEYKKRYGMLRTEWRVLFHLGRYGEMTAREICDRSRIHKTKISRAVRALQEKRFLQRLECADDRRHEILSLTKAGCAAYDELSSIARRYDAKLSAQFTPQENETLRRCLQAMARVHAGGDGSVG